MSVNKVILIGNVGKDPEIRHISEGVCVCNLPIATSETYTNKNNEKVTQTEWHTVVLWNKLAEIAEKYIQKGTQIYIEGRLRTRSWEDSDGKKRYTTEIFASNLQMLSRKNNQDNNQDNGQEQIQPEQQTTTTSAAPASEPTPTPTEDEIDDLPF